jgi:Uma2 family endonuclease
VSSFSAAEPVARVSSRHSVRGEPTWELVDQFPRQGEWTEDEYLALETNRLVEFSNGVLEFLPMPSVGHQWLLGFLFTLFADWTRKHDRPMPLMAPVPVWVRRGTYREPDLLLPNAAKGVEDRRVERPDVVLEIVSADDQSQKRDYVIKRAEYAQARIPEYWIVDPETETITVFTLPTRGAKYKLHGEFKPGQTARSKLLDGFAVNVAACFAAGKGKQT